jgi:hypothetical protein
MSIDVEIGRPVVLQLLIMATIVVVRMTHVTWSCASFMPCHDIMRA